MLTQLRETVLSRDDEPIRRTRTEAPDYLKRAIAESVERGKTDARHRVRLRFFSQLNRKQP